MEVLQEMWAFMGLGRMRNTILRNVLLALLESPNADLHDVLNYGLIAFPESIVGRFERTRQFDFSMEKEFEALHIRLSRGRLAPIKTKSGLPLRSLPIANPHRA